MGELAFVGIMAGLFGLLLLAGLLPADGTINRALDGLLDSCPGRTDERVPFED